MKWMNLFVALFASCVLFIVTAGSIALLILYPLALIPVPIVLLTRMLYLHLNKVDEGDELG